MRYCHKTLVLFFFTLYASSIPVGAEVIVEPATVVIDEASQVRPGGYFYYVLTLDANTQLVATFNVQGGLDNSLKVWFLNLANFQRYQANQNFTNFPGANGDFLSTGDFKFDVPQTNTYYLVLDNRKAVLTARNVHTHMYKIDTGETAASKAIKSLYSTLYNDYLKKLFEFPDFNIYVRMCGFPDAFSSPDITICKELEKSLDSKSVGGALLFVFLHESAHSLLNLWDYPLHDNEDVADELATVLLLIGDQKDKALQAAKWWAEQSSENHATAKHWMDDRHTVSSQRARNIVNWINNEDELERRWFTLLIPKMRDEMLELMLQDESTSETHRLVEEELVKRQAIRKGRRYTAQKD